MNFNFESIAQDLSKMGRTITKRAHGSSSEIGGVGKEYGESLGAENPGWAKAINRNSLVGQTHGVVTRAMEQLMGKTTAPYAAGAAMGVMGIGGAAFANNEMGNHPGAASAIGVGAAAVGLASVLDPAIMRNLLKEKVHSGQGVLDFGEVKVS